MARSNFYGMSVVVADDGEGWKKVFCVLLSFDDDEGTAEVPANKLGPCLDQLLAVGKGGDVKRHWRSSPL